VQIQMTLFVRQNFLRIVRLQQSLWLSMKRFSKKFRNVLITHHIQFAWLHLALVMTRMRRTRLFLLRQQPIHIQHGAKPIVIRSLNQLITQSKALQHLISIIQRFQLITHYGSKPKMVLKTHNVVLNFRQMIVIS